MNDKPLVSIICLCYNHGQYVQDALQSVKNQSYSNIELIVVDDCSTDNSAEAIADWLKKNPEIVFIKNEHNLGNTKSFNKAFAQSNGSYIIDLAADDVLAHNCVELQVEAFAKSQFSNVGIVYGNAELVFEDDTHFCYFFEVDENKKRTKPQAVGDIYLSLLRLENNVCSVSAIARREVYERFQGFNENLQYEDYDFWIKTARFYQFDFIDRILIKKRELRNSLSSRRFKRLNKKTRLYNRSTYQIVRNALQLNTTKEENRAVLQMVHFEMQIALRTIDPLLLLKYLKLHLKISYSLLFKKDFIRL